MNRPREVLLAAAAEDVRQAVAKLRELGWPAEVIAVSDPFGIQIVIPLDQIPVPVEAESEPYTESRYRISRRLLEEDS